MIVFRVWLQPRTWRELGYVITGVVVAVPTFVLALLGVVTSVLSIFTVGLPLLVLVLAVLRSTGRYFRGPARFWLGWDWQPPVRLKARGPVRRVLAVLNDPAGWRALAYCLLKFLINVVTAYGALLALVTGPLAVTAPLWMMISPTLWGLRDPGDSWADICFLALQGAAELLILPWFLRVMVGLDKLLAYALLAPTAQGRRVAELEAGRAALQEDAAALLRRVERDLHDGTQARLVSLGLTLSRLEHRSTEQPVRALAADARGTVTEALAELRDIVRGMHPPALDDGLEVALTTLAARSAVPAEVVVRLAGRPPDATASALYFAVAELLTNITRHASATRVRIDLCTDGPRIRLVVSDNGHGGASITTAHAEEPAATPSGTGLAGLRRRATALDGSFTIDSPAGGPTLVTMTLPWER